MAARQLGRRAAVPAILVAGSTLFVAQRTPTLHAEAPSSELRQAHRKPIYDDDVPIRNTAPLPERPEAPHPIADRESSLTDQLSGYVRQARVFTAVHVQLAEDKFNAGARRFFDLENNVTSTIANLAPDYRTTGERVLPGAIYVVVAGMAGQVLTRRRNVLLRATVPVVFVVGAANYLLPHTSKNIGDLLWSWEKRFPVVADNHLRARRAVEQAIEDSKKATKDARSALDDAVRKSREAVEGWVNQGK